MIDKKEIERACNSFFKEANLHVAGDIQDFDPEIILNANNDLLNMIRNTVKTYQSKYRENLEMYYICKMALEYLKIVKRGKEQVNNMSVIILDDEDMEALQNGELIHLQIGDGQIVGLGSEKWANEHPDDDASDETSKKLYLVCGNTSYFDEYGACINIFGIFTSMELAEITKKNAEDRYYEDEKEKTFPSISARDEVNFEIKEINLDEEIDIELGGYAE